MHQQTTKPASAHAQSASLESGCNSWVSLFPMPAIPGEWEKSRRTGLAHREITRYEAFTCRSRNPTKGHAEPRLLQARLGEEAARGERGGTKAVARG